MADPPARKPSSRTPAPPARTPLPGEDPFRFNNRTLPIYRMPLPLHQKRILVLVAVALVLAVIGALVGTRLLTRPRQVRTTVRTDVQALDARIWETVSCLGGPETHKDGRDLPKHLLERALRTPQWPARIETCRQKTALLLLATSAITASAHAAPSRVPDAIRQKYRHVLTAAAAVQEAVSAVAGDARAGRLLPTWPHALAVARAVGRFQRLLGEVERLADLPTPRSAPPTLDTEPPAWTQARPLAKRLPASFRARLVPLQPARAHVALQLVDPAGSSSRLLLDPMGLPRWITLPAAPKDAVRGQPVRWLQVLGAPDGGRDARILWAQAPWEARAGRADLRVGVTGSPSPTTSLPWPRMRGFAPRIHGGGTLDTRRWLLVSAVTGPARTLLYHTRQDGRTWAHPVVLATDLDEAADVRLWPTPAGPWVTYPVRGGGTALSALPGGNHAPARDVLDTAARGPVRQVCVARGATWLLDGVGGLWRRPAPKQPFALQTWPGAGAPGTRLLCFADHAALTWRDPTGRHHYVICAARGCQVPQLVSWSRLQDVLLLHSRRGALVLAATDALLFSRRDPRASGRLQPPRPLTRLSSPLRQLCAVRDPSVPGRLSVLLLGSGLTRLQSNDDGLTWAGK